MDHNNIIKLITKISVLIFLIIIKTNMLYASSFNDSIKQNLQNSIEIAIELCNKNGDSALAIIDKALIVCDEINADKEKIHLLRLKGLVYFYGADYAKSLEYSIQSRDLSIANNDLRNEIFAINNISLVYNEQGMAEKAIELDKHILKTCQKLGEKEQYAGSYNNIGYGYECLGQHGKAMKYYHLALKHAITNNMHDATDMYYNNIGSLHLDQNSLDSAKFYFKNGLRVSKLFQNKQIESNSLAYLGEYFIKKGNYDTAIIFLEESFAVAKNLDIIYEIEDIAEQLNIAYAAIGNYQKAYDFLLLYKQMADSAKNIEAMQRLTEIEVSAKYEKEKQLQEISTERNRLQNELKLRKQKNFRNITMVLFIVMVLWLCILYQNYKRKTINNKRLIAHRDEILAQKEEIESQRDEIQSLNNTKDKFFTIIAHDLRNPIGATKQLAELLHYEFNSLEQKQIITYIEHVYKSSVKTADLLENLLHWAIIQTGIIKTNPKVFNLTAIIQENVELLSNNLNQKNISINFPHCQECLAFADEEMTTTVVRNLLQNAIKFSEINSKVDFSIEKVEGFWKVSIADKGIGMNIEDQAFIFDMDYDKNNIGESKEKGTGLGLVLCKEFVELNGGIIWVKSELKKGSTFYFTIPEGKTNN